MARKFAILNLIYHFLGMLHAQSHGEGFSFERDSDVLQVKKHILGGVTRGQNDERRFVLHAVLGANSGDFFILG